MSTNKHVRYVEEMNEDASDKITMGEFRKAIDPSGQHIGLLIEGGPNGSLIVGARGPMFHRVLEALTEAQLIDPRSIFEALGILDEEP